MADLQSPQEGTLERLMRNIPGFSGYLDRERRRDADKLQRDFMAKQLGNIKRKIQTAQEEILAAGNLSLLERFDKVNNKLDRVTERLGHASYGYSGFFEVPEVNEAELQTVYEHDLSLLSEITLLDGTASSLVGNPDPGGQLTSLLSSVQALDSKIDDRERILKGVQ
jgi:hypothetical protein